MVPPFISLITRSASKNVREELKFILILRSQFRLPPFFIIMIIDDVIIQVAAGKGGDGTVRFSKTKMTLGPTGGSGGQGGSVFLQGVSDLTALRQFRFKKEAKAANGGDGKKQNGYT